jgi:hypothetical protein
MIDPDVQASWDELHKQLSVNGVSTRSRVKREKPKK